MNENKQIACPACEYERNKPGKPVEKHGQMECLDCGSKWRVFGTLNLAKHETRVEAKDKTRAQVLSEQVSFRAYEDEVKPRVLNKKQSFKPGIGLMLSGFAAVLLFVGMFYGVYFLKSEARVLQGNNLNIAEVAIKEQIRRNGEKVFTVEGVITNPTMKDRPIPPVEIILRQKNGSEIFRWQYNSALPSLSAGGKSRFASSIQYDTPIVAYAEAEFIK